MIKNARANYGIERGVGKWQGANISLTNIAEAPLPAERNCLRGGIDSYILFRISQPLKDRPRTATYIENFPVRPVRQLRLQNLKNQTMQRAIPPMRLLHAEHRSVFIRLHRFAYWRVGRNGSSIAACRSDLGKADRDIRRPDQESSVGCRQATRSFPKRWVFQGSHSE